MEYDKNESSMKKIDIVLLREKGMTRSKISKIIGVPVELIDRQLKEQKEYKNYSGIL